MEIQGWVPMPNIRLTNVQPTTVLTPSRADLHRLCATEALFWDQRLRSNFNPDHKSVGVFPRGVEAGARLKVTFP